VSKSTTPTQKLGDHQLARLALSLANTAKGKAAHLPSQFDWAKKGAVTPVQSQATNGSCWAFSAIGNMEGVQFVRGEALVKLSEQNLLDCAVCAEPWCAFQWVVEHGGVMSEAAYPRQSGGGNGICRYDRARAAARFSSWALVRCGEEELRTFLLENGPVSVGVHAEEWRSYSGGVFDAKCDHDNDHMVLLTGYGQIHDVKYWILKNSFVQAQPFPLQKARLTSGPPLPLADGARIGASADTSGWPEARTSAAFWR
jgi:cysteine peptidase B